MTYRELRDEIATYVGAGDALDAIDIDAVTREIIATYGVVSVDTIDAAQFDAIIQRHAAA